MDNCEFKPEIRKSRFLRICPECRMPIEKGQHYAKVCGVYENEIFDTVMCLPCNEFRERYIKSMQACHVDPVEYHFSDIINEANEHMDLRIRLPPDLTLAQKRGVLMSMFEMFDNMVRLGLENKRVAVQKSRDLLANSQKTYREKVYSQRMIEGMSRCGCLYLDDPDRI